MEILLLGLIIYLVITNLKTITYLVGAFVMVSLFLYFINIFIAAQLTYI
jgi:hypothetical protein